MASWSSDAFVVEKGQGYAFDRWIEDKGRIEARRSDDDTTRDVDWSSTGFSATPHVHVVKARRRGNPDCREGARVGAPKRESMLKRFLRFLIA